MPKRLFQLFAVCLLMAPLLFVSMTNVPSIGAQSSAILLKAPRKIQVGKAIRVRVKIRGAENVAGFESQVLFDTSVAEFGGVTVRQNLVKQAGRDIIPLAATSRPEGAVIGFASCPFDDCTMAGKGNARGANGNFRLATFYVVPLAPG